MKGFADLASAGPKAIQDSTLPCFMGRADRILPVAGRGGAAARNRQADNAPDPNGVETAKIAAFEPRM
jgi:hypothetical protein